MTFPAIFSFRYRLCHGLLVSALALGSAGCQEPQDPEVPTSPGPGPVGEGGGPSKDMSDHVFDESVIHQISLDVREEDWRELNDNIVLEEYVPASITYDGERMENVGLRYKGSIGSLTDCLDAQGRPNDKCNKLSFKVKFNEYEKEQLYEGMNKINLHGFPSDPSMMREALSYKLFRDQGIPAPRTSYVRIQINGEHMGLYLAVESIDQRFAGDRYGDDGGGNLYKEVWPAESTGDNKYAEALKSNRSAPDVSKIKRFSDAIKEGGASGFKETMTQWTDLNQWVTYFAISRLIEHWDGPLAWYCGDKCLNHNYFFYESNSQDKLWIVPWDFDMALFYINPHTDVEEGREFPGVPLWTDVNADCQAEYRTAYGTKAAPPSCDPILRFTVTELWDEYTARVRELMSGAMSRESMNSRIDQLAALINAEVADDPVMDYDFWLENEAGFLKYLVGVKFERVEDEID